MFTADLNGRYLVQTSANKIEVQTRGGLSWVTAYNKSSGGIVRGFIIELDGKIRVSEGTNFDSLLLGSYEGFYFKALQS